MSYQLHPGMDINVNRIPMNSRALKEYDFKLNTLVFDVFFPALIVVLLPYVLKNIEETKPFIQLAWDYLAKLAVPVVELLPKDWQESEWTLFALLYIAVFLIHMLLFSKTIWKHRKKKSLKKKILRKLSNYLLSKDLNMEKMCREFGERVYNIIRNENRGPTTPLVNPHFSLNFSGTTIGGIPGAYISFSDPQWNMQPITEPTEQWAFVCAVAIKTMYYAGERTGWQDPVFVSESAGFYLDDWNDNDCTMSYSARNPGYIPPRRII